MCLTRQLEEHNFELDFDTLSEVLMNINNLKLSNLKVC